MTRIQAAWAPECAMRRGVLAYVAGEFVGPFRLDGLVLRRTPEGGLALAYPAHVQPATREVGEVIQQQVLDALGILRDERP